MAAKVAVINMKGGVGKSTLCTNLAWHFSTRPDWDKRVLLVDLDPQFNASQYTLGVMKYEDLIVKRGIPTVWDIFEQATRAPGLRSSGRKLADAVIKVAEYQDGSYLHLIASQLELSFTLKNPSQKEHLLSNFISEIEENYDLILVDCAPTESVLTTAAYLTCDDILIPVKPEFLSTIGLPLIRQSVADFTKLFKKNLKLLGICFNGCTDYSPEETKAKDEVRDIAEKFKWHVFDEEVPYSRSFPKGAREGAPIFRTSYAHSKVSSKVGAFCDAFAKKAKL
jgi:chromosome partitioning protein